MGENGWEKWRREETRERERERDKMKEGRGERWEGKRENETGN